MTRVGERDMSPANGISIAFARPKSRTLTLPSGVILMFAGFRSRWMMPFSCATSSASAICDAMRSESATGSGSGREALRERLALDELHDDVTRRAVLLDAVDRGDRRMVEGREHPRLALEPRHAVRVAGEFRGQHLDGDVAPELAVARAVDLAHAAGAEEVGDFVRSEPGAGLKGHGSLGDSIPCLPLE